MLSSASPTCAVLPNGLRVVAYHMPGNPACGISVHYGTGFRAEPRSGFAHLFEHMMFQSTGRHFDAVYGAGGTANGSTFQDYTEYEQVVPVDAVRDILELEARRMRSLRLTEEAMRTQLAVVAEEIRLNIHSRPYGGFPWTVMPGFLYRSWVNSHNGYGDLADVGRATIAECQAFHSSHYAPGNAVLTICGGIEDTLALAWAEEAFGKVEARPVAPPPVLSEPELAGDRQRGKHSDPMAPQPALALGWRMPDPAGDPVTYRGLVVLAAALTAPGAPLREELADLRSSVAASGGFFGPWQARDPDTFIITVTHPADISPAVVEELVDSHLVPDRIVRQEEQVRGAARHTATDWWRKHDSLASLTCCMGVGELLFATPRLVLDLPARLAAVTTSDAVRAVEYLAHAPSALVTTGAAA